MERKIGKKIVDRIFKLDASDWKTLKLAQKSLGEPMRSRMKFIRKTLKKSDNKIPLEWVMYHELREHRPLDTEKFNNYLRSIDSPLRLASLTRGNFNEYEYRFYK